MIRTKPVLTFKARLRSRCSWETLAKFGIGIASSIAITSFSTSTLALNVEEVPNPKQVNGGWVTDQANILSSATEADINHLISEIAAKNGTEMAVVTVPSTAPSATPKEFAIALFNRWGIGKKGEDNGVLLLISKSDRRVEVETGYGVEDILPDAKVGNIISQKMSLEFKKGDFDKGTLAGTEALVQAIEAQVISDTSNESAKNLSTNLPTSGLFYLHYLILGLGAGVLIIIFVNYIRDKKENPNILSDSESDRPLGQKRQSNSNSAMRNSRTTHAATESKRGKRVNTNTTDTYHWYNERNQGEEIIDRIPPPSPPSPPDKSSNWSSSDSSSQSSDSGSSSSDWGSSSSSDWGSSSSSDYGSSSDWGGGSSGGGGAGDSW